MNVGDLVRFLPEITRDEVGKCVGILIERTATNPEFGGADTFMVLWNTILWSHKDSIALGHGVNLDTWRTSMLEVINECR